jgi:GNAT superfamily N-acetyltransferase
MSIDDPAYLVRRTVPTDFERIARLSEKVYPTHPIWTIAQLQSHIELFPEGQIVVEDLDAGALVGMSASLIVMWDDYSVDDNYLTFTGNFFFTNHDPAGDTLYGAEVMVDPDYRGEGIGSLIYEARRQVVRDCKLLRIRAGARIPGYHLYADSMTVEEYVRRVEAEELNDPTLSFQLAQGFRIIRPIANYYIEDPECRNYGVLIEWPNDSL